MCERTGYCAFECELHRARGDILPKCDPTNPAPAEDAFKTAIALAKRQGARGYQLLASLALAKLYRTTSRLSKPTPSSRLNSKASRRRRRCRRSRRRRRC